MNRFFQTITALFLVLSVSAQDLAHKIPNDAFAVVNIRTDHFFKLMSVDDFDRSNIGKIIIEKSRQADLQEVNSIADFGIALDRPGYFYATLSDSIVYLSFLLPIADVEKVEAHFAKGETVSSHGKFRSFTKAATGDSVIFAWDETMLSITTPSLVDGYFLQDDVAERYGIRNYSYADYYNQPVDEEATDWGSVEWWADSVYADTAAWDEVAAVADSVYAEADSVAYEYDDYNDATLLGENQDEENLYDTYYAADQEIKRKLANEWGEAFVESQFNSVPVASVLTNRSYLSSVSKDALATLWIPSFEAIYTALLPELLDFGESGDLFSYYGSLQVGLFADKEGFKLRSQMELEDSMAKTFKRIYGRKLNRKFLKYINVDEAIGLFALSMDTRAYLEELPGLLKNTYANLFEQYKDDISLGADLVSLLLDEAAIAKTAKGDALFVLNGLAEQEVPYISYEYDEDYNYTEVEATKVETIPDFLLMFSSDDVSLYNRIMTYTTRKGYVTEDDGVYRLSQEDLPFELVFTRKNGVVFVGTSVEQLASIVAGSYQGKVDRQTRRLLTKNKFAGLLSARKLSKEVPTEQLVSLDRYIAFQKIFGSMGDFYFKSDGVKGNHISAEFVARTPQGYDNAIQYLFGLVDYALDQR
ncbi:hypothetical protein [Parapedobacter soli]|uniref:hypothetical protein n=1 Tax=Parapedobacter soli TaxID=416955 RepID=UPI0021CA9158|nr:hypothetical protein [Parapedobacter soli]